MPYFAYEPLRILIIDDDPHWCKTIGMYVEALRHIRKSVSNFEEAKVAIKEAEENKNPFSIAIIDRQFKVGEDKTKTPFGTDILRYIKSQYPYIACIMVSADVVPYEDFFDLRDELDYYVPKHRLDSTTLENAIAKAMGRVRPLGSTDRRHEVLKEALEKYRDICAIYTHNLAVVERQKAQKGIDVSVDIENQIETYEIRLREANDKVRQIKEEIRQLGGNQPTPASRK
jgi:CheY-like chemotaxis protein